MRMRTRFSVALWAAAIGAQSVASARADESAPTGDLAKLQGQWTATFGSRNIVVLMTIKGSQATLAFTFPDGRHRESQGEIKLDENAKPYKTLDWINFTTRGGEKSAPNLGIYRFEGDAITICNGGPGNERPTEFKAGERGQPQLFSLKRKTEGAAASSDREKLQGRWSGRVGPEKKTLVALTIKGTNATLNATLVIDGPSGRRESKGELKIDENAKPFKTLDWVNFISTTGKSAAAPNLAIYKLDGDTLTICSGGVGNERPTEFKAGEEGRPSLIVLNHE